MKSLILVAASSLVAGALGQTTLPSPEGTILQAYQKLQTAPNLQLTLQGTSSSFGTTQGFASVLFFSTAANPHTNLQTSIKLELDDYDTSGSKPVLVHRYVADGQNLYSYDLSNLRYSSTFYSYQGAQPVDYPGSDGPRLLAQLYAVVKGPSSNLVRMLREINPPATNSLTTESPTGLASFYSTWAPGETPTFPTDIISNPLAGGPPIQIPDPTPDPLNSLDYVVGVAEGLPTGRIADSADYWALYGPGMVNPNRSTAFGFINIGASGSSPDLHLQRVYMTDRSSTRKINWRLQIFEPAVVNPMPTLPTFAFKPYPQTYIQGWQPISSPTSY